MRLVLLSLVLAGSPAASSYAQQRPNVLFAIADDWGYPHAGAYGDEAARTKTFDRLAREGVLFENAFVATPSCTPSRNAVLTGCYPWSLREGASLHSRMTAPPSVYPHLLEDAGYHTGHWRKSYGPGPIPEVWKARHPAGKRYANFAAFLEARPDDAPFCFWLGSPDPHRPYENGSGARSGIDPERVHVPGFLPDDPIVRSDIADYLFEVERFDRDVGEALALLEARGELENTIVVMTGDHGMPFPRCKSNLYLMGVQVPLAIRFGERVKHGRRVRDFVSLVDLAPTYLELAGLSIPETMQGRSLVPVLTRASDEEVEPERRYVVFGKERHVPAQAAPSMEGYPCRGICDGKHLLIVNHEPARWPAGVLEGSTHGTPIADCDGGPTKAFLIRERERDAIRSFYELCFGKRPALELYDLAQDPDQLVNLAGHPEQRATVDALRSLLEGRLRATGDPRVTGGEVAFDTFPYFGRTTGKPR